MSVVVDPDPASDIDQKRKVFSSLTRVFSVLDPGTVFCLQAGLFISLPLNIRKMVFLSRG